MSGGGKGCNVENTSSLNGFGHGIEQWVQQMERLAPLSGQGPLSAAGAVAGAAGS